MSPFSIRQADFERDFDALRRIRVGVFCIEQNVPEALEWDGIDVDCEHALAVDAQGVAVGCGRLLPDGHIGRLAVVPAWRGRGVGSALLTYFAALARERGHAIAHLNAQMHAIPFYEAHGFAITGEPYDDAGIPHQAMSKALR
jgi:predicted GNAT family N-acyltransferase